MKTWEDWLRLPNIIAFLILTASNFTHAEQYYGDRIGRLDLGKGYFSDQLHLSEPCIEGQIIYTPRQKGTLNFLSQMTDEDIREQTFGEIHGGVNLFIASGSASTSITHNVAKDELSANLSMHMNLDYGEDTLEIRNEAAGASKDTCGDSFVYQINYGRDIFLTAKLHFNSLDEYKKFVTKITVRVLFVKKTWTKTKIIKEFAQNAVLTIDVDSNGELPSRLKTLIAQNPTTCRGESIVNCIDTYHMLSQYLFDNTGLIMDLETMPKPVRSMHTRSYGESGHFNLAGVKPVPNPILFNQLKAIEAHFGSLVQLERRTRAFYDTAESEAEQVVRYTEWQAALNNRDQFSALRNNCFAKPDMQLCDILE